MKLLIVGGNSTLAQVLLPKLSLFAEVLTAGRSGCDIKLDLTADQGVFHLPKDLDVVVHLAAHFGGKNFADFCTAQQVNVLGTLKVCHAAQLAGISHFVLISTIFAGLGEDSPSFSSYALSKRHAEDVARFYFSNVNLPLAILRPSQIYGVGEKFRKHQPFLYNIIDRVESNKDVVFYGSRDARRNLIHVEDVAEVISEVVRKRIQGQYNCPALTNAPYSEIASAAIKAFNSTSKVHFVPEKPDIIDNTFELDESLYRQINFWPQITLEQGMKKEAAYRKGVI